MVVVCVAIRVARVVFSIKATHSLLTIGNPCQSVGLIVTKRRFLNITSQQKRFSNITSKLGSKLDASGFVNLQKQPTLAMEEGIPLAVPSLNGAPGRWPFFVYRQMYPSKQY